MERNDNVKKLADQKEEDRKIRKLNIKIQCFIEYKDSIWFVPEEASILCKYDLNQERIVHIWLIPGDAMRALAYNKILKYQNKLVFIPFGAEEVAIFDIEEEAFTKIKLPEEAYQNFHKFDDGFIKDNYIYLIPGTYPYVLRINMNNYKLEQSKNLYKMCQRYLNKLKGTIDLSAGSYDGVRTLFIGYGVYYDREIYVGVLKINIETFHIYIRELRHVESWIKGMLWHNERLFLYSAEGKVSVFDEKLETIEVITNSLLKDYVNPEDMGVAYICADHEKLIIIRRRGLETIIMNLNDLNSISKRKFIDEPIKYAGCIKSGVLLQSLEEGYFWILNNKKCEIKYVNIERNILLECIQNLISNHKDILEENIFFRLSEWIELVYDKNRDSVKIENNGSKIYFTLLSDIH